MSEFTTTLKVSPHRDGINWILIEKFHFNYKKELKIQVQKGFITDFASVPWFLRWLCPTWGKFGYAAIIHDWLYWQQERAKVTKPLADQILREGMRVSEVSPIFENIIYYAVKFCGYPAWWQNQIDRENHYERVNLTQINDPTIKVRPSSDSMLVGSKIYKLGVNKVHRGAVGGINKVRNWVVKPNK
jgi:hypothetical protein